MVRVLAITAHPDDIEFGMAGTLILLYKAGCEIHYMNLANGSCGTSEFDIQTITRIRRQEAEKAAERIGARFHPPLVNDLEIYYNKDLIAKLGSVIRKVEPDILLIPSPEDYMEDHINTCRVSISAAFIRGMRNCPVDPPVDPILKEVVLYHAQPHGNRDAMNRLIHPDIFVNIEVVMDEKTAMLEEHKSQKEWLDRSQGFNSYLNTMKSYSREMGEISACFKYAEGWRRHNPLGFCAPDADPLMDLIPDYTYSQGEKT
jgi:LmbE family N-acetylglucosaminyl deacetylase